MIKFRVFAKIMFKKFKCWYCGSLVVHEGEAHPDIGLFILPSVERKYHWTAKIARQAVSFLIRHWQWFIPTALTALGTYFAFLALK
jgi:hypothetical protein